MGDWFVAVGAGTAWSNTGAEEVAIWASPDPEVALFATGTLVHNRVWPSGYGFDSSGCMSSSVAGLFTGIAAEPATAR